MSVSNCSSSGGDSRAAPITGVVTRKDKVTGQDIPASIRGNGAAPEADSKTSGQAVNASLSSSTLSVLLAHQEA